MCSVMSVSHASYSLIQHNGVANGDVPNKKKWKEDVSVNAHHCRTLLVTPRVYSLLVTHFLSFVSLGDS